MPGMATIEQTRDEREYTSTVIVRVTDADAREWDRERLEVLQHGIWLVERAVRGDVPRPAFRALSAMLSEDIETADAQD